MHEIQQKLLDIARLEDISKIRQKHLVSRVGCDYPSQIAHHLGQLLKRGDLVRTTNKKIIVAADNQFGNVRIPILGEADCGEATRFADNTIQDYLTLSMSVLSVPKSKAYYALIARGDSMDMAKIGSKSIEDGDYVIVEKMDYYRPNDNEYVVSIINGMANIKKFGHDKLNNRILLMSESTKGYAPIVIAEEDREHYSIAGRVVDVVRGVNA